MDSALRIGHLFRDSRHPMRQIYQLCGNNPMCVIGTVNPTAQASGFDASHVLAYMAPLGSLPSIFCPRGCNISVQIIVFDRPSPHRMQYMSLSPISLILGDKALNTDRHYHVPSSKELIEDESRAQNERLREKLKLHTVVRHPASQKENLLSTILGQINCSSELAELIDSNSYLLGPRQRRSLSVGEKVVESATTLRDYVLAMTWHAITVWVYPILTRAFIMGLICHRLIAEVVLRVLEWRPRPDSAALKDVSATAQQVDIRLQQFCYWPIQYLTLRKRRDEWESVNDRHPDYIRFYNSLWLVANDVIIGIAIGSYMIDNATWVAWQIDTVLSGWTVEGLRDMIAWLMDWPAGLKLNTELAKFLGDLFLWVIDDCWRGETILESTAISAKILLQSASIVSSLCSLMSSTSSAFQASLELLCQSQCSLTCCLYLRSTYTASILRQPVSFIGN